MTNYWLNYYNKYMLLLDLLASASAISHLLLSENTFTPCQRFTCVKTRGKTQSKNSSTVTFSAAALKMKKHICMSKDTCGAHAFPHTSVLILFAKTKLKIAARLELTFIIHKATEKLLQPLRWVLTTFYPTFLCNFRIQQVIVFVAWCVVLRS